VIAGAVRPATSQSVLEFDAWMQKIDRRTQSVQRNLAQRNTVAALADARELGQLYELMEGYFTRRGDAADGAKLATDGGAFIHALVESLQCNDVDAAARSAGSVTRACRECHIKYKPLEP
jgi:hypothetical protein